MTTLAFTAAGAVIYIAAALPATFNKAGYEALTWIEIGEVDEIPEFGKVFNLVTFNPLKTRRTEKLKGSFNDGTSTIGYGYVKGNTGQAAVMTAVGVDVARSFKIVLQDTGHIYFPAMVMSRPVNIGTVDNIVKAKAQLEITGDILEEVAPT